MDKAESYDSNRFQNKVKIGEGAYGIVVKAYDSKHKLVSLNSISNQIFWQNVALKKIKNMAKDSYSSDQ